MEVKVGRSEGRAKHSLSLIIYLVPCHTAAVTDEIFICLEYASWFHHPFPFLHSVFLISPRYIFNRLIYFFQNLLYIFTVISLHTFLSYKILAKECLLLFVFFSSFLCYTDDVRNGECVETVHIPLKLSYGECARRSGHPLEKETRS